MPPQAPQLPAAFDVEEVTGGLASRGSELEPLSLVLVLVRGPLGPFTATRRLATAPPVRIALRACSWVLSRPLLLLPARASHPNRALRGPRTLWWWPPHAPLDGLCGRSCAASIGS